MTPTTFTELAADWLAQTGQHLRGNSPATYRQCIANAGKHVVSLNGNLAAELLAWQTARRQHIASASFQLELGVVKSVLAWGMKNHGMPSADCWSTIKAGAVRNQTFKIPTREQFDQIVADIRKTEPALADFTEFLGESGCRFREALAIQWRDVDLSDNGTLLIGRDGIGKTGSRILPLFARLRIVLERLHQPRGFIAPLPQDFVFDQRLNPRSAIHQACRTLGIEPVRVHDLRHFFAMSALRACGIDRAHISAKWCGHSVSTHLERYTNHVDETESMRMAKLMK